MYAVTAINKHRRRQAKLSAKLQNMCNGVPFGFVDYGSIFLSKINLTPKGSCSTRIDLLSPTSLSISALDDRTRRYTLIALRK